MLKVKIQKKLFKPWHSSVKPECDDNKSDTVTDDTHWTCGHSKKYELRRKLDHQNNSKDLNKNLEKKMEKVFENLWIVDFIHF